MAESPHGFCVKPSLVAMITKPSEGCAFWREEPRADELAALRRRRLESGSSEARAVAQAHPRVDLVILADDDAHLVNNPTIGKNVGLEAAHAAALAVGGRVAIPPRKDVA